MKHSISIVGAHFRPPAKAILAHLPTGTALTLVPEPENQYDSNAIQVCVSPKEIPESQHSQLDLVMQGYGFDLADTLKAESIHLGYIPKTLAEGLIASLNLALEPYEAKEYPATLAFDGAGKPIAVFDL